MKKYLLEAIVFIALSATIACQPGRRVDDGAAQSSPADSCSASFQDFLNYFRNQNMFMPAVALNCSERAWR